MFTLLFRRPYALAAAAALVLAAAGCTSPGGGGESTTASSAPASPGGAGEGGGSGTTLTGAGATFPEPVYQKWFQEFGQQTGIKVNYQPIGSGGGIKQITSHTVDFGASDAPMTDTELKGAPGIIHIPTVAGAVCVSYNLSGVTKPLNLTGDVIAGMFDGSIKNWNDPKIAALNPGVTLPASAIVPVHRADGSGTTNAFTTYLSEVSPEWKQTVGAGKSVKWPGGVGQKGNPGVAALVQQTPNAVGYIELNYALANKIAFAAVKNAAGNYILPSLESTTVAASGVTMPPDFRKVIVNTSAPKGYPITSFTFLLVYPNAKPEVKKFLQWALTDGQKEASSLYYAPLPPNVDKQALAVIAKIQ